MKQPLKVTVIILNWNGEKFLKQNMKSVLDQDYPKFEILAVDNGSEDDSVKYLKKIRKKQKGKLNVLELNKNLGFTGGNNKGVEKVISEGKSKYVVFLNNDVWVEKDWLSNLISGFEREEIGICTSKMLLYYPYQQINILPSKDCKLKNIQMNVTDYHILEYPDGFDASGQLLTLPKHLEAGEVYRLAVPVKRGFKKAELKVNIVGGEIKLFSGEEKFELEKSGKIDLKIDSSYVIQSAGNEFEKSRMNFVEKHLLEFDKPLESKIVDGGCGGAMAVRVDLLKSLGSFKQEYYLYFEDSELSHRFARKGFKTKFVSDAVCYHWFWGASGTKQSASQVFYMVRNRLWFIRQYFGIIAYVYFALRSTARVFLFIVRGLFDKRSRFYAKYYSKATVASLRRSSKAVNSRQ